MRTLLFEPQTVGDLRKGKDEPCNGFIFANARDIAEQERIRQHMRIEELLLMNIHQMYPKYLSQKTKDEINEAVKSGSKIKEAANKFGVALSTVSRIVNDKKYPMSGYMKKYRAKKKALREQKNNLSE